MYTMGFTCQVSDIVTLDTFFVAPQTGSNQIICSTYIWIPTTGAEGGIVYENPVGDICWWPYAFVGYNPIAARKVLTTAVVNSITRNTTATPLYWGGAYNA